jgi:hypothetical protein
MAADGAVFTFDVKPFLNSINAMWTALGKTTDNAKRMAASVTNALQNIGTTIGASVQHGIILASGLMNKALVAFKGLQKEMFDQIPEVSQAFDIAKDVMFQNLFWPLRKEIMPLLMQMTTWVTEHRALFVKWGQAAANVFKAVVELATQLWTVFKALADTVGTAFNRAFNTNFRSFQEFLDVLSFKVVAVIMYFKLLAGQLKIDIQPFFDWFFKKVKEGITWFNKFIKKIGEIDGWAHTLETTMGLMGAAIEGLGGIFTTFLESSANFVKGIIEADENGNSLATVLTSLTDTVKILSEFGKNAISGFFDGFIDATPTLMTGITDIINRFNVLLQEIGLDKSNSVYNVFNKLGQLMGTVLTDSIDTLSSAMQSLTVFIREINANPNTSTFLSSIYQSFLGISKISKEAISSFFTGFFENLSPIINPLKEMSTAFQNILTALFGADGDEANSFFTKLGTAVAKVSVDAMDALASVMTSLASALTAIKGDPQTGNLINNMFTAISVISSTAADAIKGLFSGLADSLPELVMPLAGIAGNLGTLITTLNGNSGDGVMNFFDRLGTSLGRVAVEVATGIDHMMASLVEFFKEIKADPATAQLIEGIFSAFEKLAGITRVATESMFEGFLTAMETITTPANELVGYLNRILDVILGVDKDGERLGSVFNELGRILGAVAEGSLLNLAVVFKHLAEFMEKAAGKTDIAGILGGVADGIVKLNGWRAEKLDEALTAFGGFLERHPPSGIGDTISTIATALGPLAGKVWDGIEGLFTGIGNTFDKASGAVGSFIVQVITGLTNLAGHVDIKEIFTELGTFLGTSIADGMTKLSDILDPIVTFAKGIVTHKNFKDILSNVGGILKDFTTFSLDTFTTELETLLPVLQNLVTPLANTVESFRAYNTMFTGNNTLQNAFRSLSSILGSTLITVLTGLAIALDAIFSTIRQIVGAVSAMKNPLDFAGFKEGWDNTETGLAARTVENLQAIQKSWETTSADMGGGGKAPQTVQYGMGMPADIQKALTNSKDALITKGGRVIQFDPNDNIIAMQHLEHLTGARNRGAGEAMSMEGVRNMLEKFVAGLPSAGITQRAIENMQTTQKAWQPSVSGLGGGGKDTAVNVNDALITKGGRGIQFAPDDNIIAAKKFPVSVTGGAGGNRSAGNITINMGGVTVAVTEGDAENAGRRFADSMAARFRDQISDQLLREGY